MDEEARWTVVPPGTPRTRCVVGHQPGRTRSLVSRLSLPGMLRGRHGPKKAAGLRSAAHVEPACKGERRGRGLILSHQAVEGTVRRKDSHGNGTWSRADRAVFPRTSGRGICGWIAHACNPDGEALALVACRRVCERRCHAGTSVRLCRECRYGP